MQTTAAGINIKDAVFNIMLPNVNVLLHNSHFDYKRLVSFVI